MVAVDDGMRLRLLLGEAIPEGGSVEDTMFTDEQIAFLIDEHGSVEAALGEGWAMKAAALSTLVTTVEGASQRKLSDAAKAAERMARINGWAGARGRTRIGNISRPVGG